MVECSFRTDGWMEKEGYEYCTITSTHIIGEFPGHFTCKEEKCILQKQLKLLEEIVSMVKPIPLSKPER